MKTNRSMIVLSALAALSACKEKEVPRADSSYITVTSPSWKQEINDTEEIVVKAVIKPQEKSVVSYYIYLIDNEKKEIYNKKTECDCKDKDEVQVEASFKYDIKKTSELLLHVDAVLSDGSNIREEIPFKLVDVKK
ncbi:MULTISPECIES: hypothetical protein [unclassified Dyadobacter]|uniref:hypothetical protein n=1 Tax=unclassified Dyadobacter TaxID=2625061 RepID=UPI001F1DF447|nr:MULTISPECIES: hypothetical protein [unclassified Dyadobacter]MCE7069120.1 hypothetical protein [Dyadobacter sp. CY327]MCF2516067.1 hypothetical protein [Dyadobacter sp. CY351]